jgi:hypothetical protein
MFAENVPMTESKAMLSVLRSAVERKQGNCRISDMPKLEPLDVTITLVRVYYDNGSSFLQTVTKM